MTNRPIVLFNTPWGEAEVSSDLDFLKHVIHQLEWFLENNKSPDPEYTQQDLEGYRLLQATGSEMLVNRFFIIKDEYRQKGVYATSRYRMLVKDI